MSHPEQLKRALRNDWWSLVELWDDIAPRRYRRSYVTPHMQRRMAFRAFLCREGLHWPITFWDCIGGYSSPPEYGWACESCGRERLPYRAFLWRIPLVRRLVP